MGGMTQARIEKRVEPPRWPCPSEDHPGASILYLDHPSWYRAVKALNPANRGKRFLTLDTYASDSPVASTDREGSYPIGIFTPMFCFGITFS